MKRPSRQQVSRQKLDTQDLPDEFFFWLRDVLTKALKEVEYGRIELTIVGGSLENVHVTHTYKPSAVIDRDGNLELKLG